MASIHQKDNGRWAVRWRDPDGRQRWQSFRLKSDAKAFAKTVDYHQTATPSVPVRTRVLFSEYVNDWTARQVWRPNTCAQVEGQLRNHLLPAFGSRQLSAIQRRDVQLWIQDLSTELSPATVKLLTEKLRSVLGEAVRDRLIAENPAKAVKLPRIHRRTPTIPTLEQVAVLRDALPERYRIVPEIITGSGLRISEVLGLSVDRVDGSDLSIRVDRQRAPGRAELFAPPKSSASVRTVPVPRSLVESIAQHVERYGTGPAGLLVSGERSQPLQRWALQRPWEIARASAGLGPGIGPHSLRHLYASMLIRAGCSVKVVQHALGHATAAETLDTYAHLWPDDGDRVRAAVAAGWSIGMVS